jgi:hypothetical protein
VKKNTASQDLLYISGTYSYTVNLKLQPHGPEVHCEPVSPADLVEIYSETWLSSYLRKGQPELDFNDLAFRLLPLFNAGADHRCRKLMVESKQSDGKILYEPNDVKILRMVAERGAKRLIDTRMLAFGQPYYYEVIAKEYTEVTQANAQLEPGGTGSSNIKFSPLSYRKVHLSSLLEKAATVGAVQESIPIFIKKSAYLKAEQSARNGARCNPPVESGAAILGWLGSCPETGEFFVVATEIIELVDALQKESSLTYTDKTWANIYTVLKERKTRPDTKAERMVGQCHGHNFLPCAGDTDCAHCVQQNKCRATSVFVSENDLLWSRCVFSRQPWAFCLIFGLDARGGHVQRMFGFKNGRLIERGFYLIA